MNHERWIWENFFLSFLGDSTNTNFTKYYLVIGNKDSVSSIHKLRERILRFKAKEGFGQTKQITVLKELTKEEGSAKETLEIHSRLNN